MKKKTKEEARYLYEDRRVSAVVCSILTGLDIRTITNLAAKEKWKAGRCDLCNTKYRRRTGVTIKEDCYELYFCEEECRERWDALDERDQVDSKPSTGKIS